MSLLPWKPDRIISISHVAQIEDMCGYQIEDMCGFPTGSWPKIAAGAKSSKMAKTPPPPKTYFLAGYIARIQCLQIYFDSAYIKSLIYKLSCFLPEVNIFF